MLGKLKLISTRIAPLKLNMLLFYDSIPVAPGDTTA